MTPTPKLVSTTNEASEDGEPAAPFGDDDEIHPSPALAEDLEGGEEVMEEGVLQRRVSTRVRGQPKKYWVAVPHLEGLAAFEPDPSTLREALAREDKMEWQRAMDKEMESLRKNKTWDLTELPKGRKAISCKWVLRIKRDAKGSVVKYKARLCVRGFTQKYGIDYTETFASVAKMPSLRVVLALAAYNDWELHHMDVTTAFLNADLEEEIYMQQPEGYVEAGKEHLVCKLNKSLYGLKQAPRAWYFKLHAELVRLGFTRLEADHSLYLWLDGEELVLLVVHVDDIVVASNSLEALQEFKEAIMHTFEMTDLGDLSYYLGIKVERDRGSKVIRMSQAHYVMEVLERFGMTECKPTTTPMDTKTRLLPHDGVASAEEVKEYQRVVGSLMYAMVATRPDLGYAVGALCRYMSNPSPSHWCAAKRVLRYLAGTIHHALTYGRGNMELVGYTDADFAAPPTRHSTSGYLFILNGGAVSWASKRQKSVATSTTEAEYMALALGTKEAIWLRRLLGELGMVSYSPTLLLVDNQSCIKLAKNPENHQLTKHIDTQYHFIREEVERQIVRVEFCPTKAMAADFLTKPVARDQHMACSRMSGLPM